jgi:hypothetical protein
MQSLCERVLRTQLEIQQRDGQMSSTSSLPLSARVELTAGGDGLRRWVRLRRIWDRAVAAPESDSEALAALARQLDEALDQAAAHAENLSTFLEKNGDLVGELVAASGESRREALGARLGSDPVEGAKESARAFVAGVEGERQFMQGQVAGNEETEEGEGGEEDGKTRRASDPFCDAVADLVMESYLGCEGDGDEEACDDLDFFVGIGGSYGC